MRLLVMSIAAFDATVSPVVLFGAGHRALHQGDLHQMDLTFTRIVSYRGGPACWH